MFKNILEALNEKKKEKERHRRSTIHCAEISPVKASEVSEGYAFS